MALNITDVKPVWVSLQDVPPTEEHYEKGLPLVCGKQNMSGHIVLLQKGYPPEGMYYVVDANGDTICCYGYELNYIPGTFKLR